MLCQVYCEDKGQMLLLADTPGVALAPEVENRFGTLKRCGAIDTTEFSSSLKLGLESQLSARAYAVVSFGMVEDTEDEQALA